MNIKRILLLTGMALAAIAFAAPAIAQAEVTLTENQVPLQVNDSVTATSTDFKTTTASGTIECTSIQLHLTVTTNGLDHAVLHQNGVATTSGCALNIGVSKLPLTVTDWTLGELTINTWGAASATVTFVSHIYNNAAHTELIRTCHFHGSAGFQGAESGGDVLNFGPSTLTGTGASCPTSATTHGSFTLETTASPFTRVDLDFVETG